MTNETGSIRVVMNGEIYNYRELRDELIQKGHRFVSRCDTEVLVHLYEQEGEEGVHRLRGMFAYALWDQERQRLLLVRDRLGIKPLYYAVRLGGHGQSQVFFASELPALLSALPQRSIRPRAVTQYLSHLYVPDPETIFEGVRQLRPGELLRVGKGHVETKRYFNVGTFAQEASTNWYEADPQASSLTGEGAASAAKERFLTLVRDSVRAHLVSDVPLGLFLSGGLDSAAILATMRAVTEGPIMTFSIGYDAAVDRAYDELKAARLLADRFGTQHTEERLRPDAVALLPRIVQAMGEPFADSSAIPTYLVSEVARRSVTVALSGIGGDELFGGYPRYLGVRAAACYARLPAGLRTLVANHIAPHLPEGQGGRDQLGRVKRFLRGGQFPVAEQYRRWMTFLPQEWGRAAFADNFVATAWEVDAEVDDLSAFERWPSDEPADRAMGFDIQTYLPDDLLKMGDRLSMVHSLELRVPFCDHLLLGFALGLPASLRLAGWKLKAFMRQALVPLLPKEILSRPKFGFSIPLARWLREDLREMLGDLLSDEAVRRRGYLRPEYVGWLRREHEAGHRNFADQLYALLVLELWQQGLEGMRSG
jgi:asparagine synthase (glutamine-hydrolysing)